MTTGNVYRVALVGTAEFGQTLVNTLYYRALAGTILDAQAEDLAQAVVNDVVTPHKDCHSSKNNLVLVSVRGITDPLEGFDFPLSPSVAGSITGDALPPQSAAVITWTTGLVGRRYRGRMFCWPAGETSQNGGFITGGYQAGLDAFALAIRAIGDGIATAAYEQVVWSSTFSLATKVTGATSRTQIYTQKRRVLGKGA